ncbi:glycosyltransferase family 4 protein [Acidipropionibacterium virtanenii]|uniref:D-inositol-3-phosphate glycosyltransferase n=1 Tax=Acidipropionibacterium virtanenii TaxID=2057246 RepID=A0A344UXF4_9ACTN|nr:glycosyltransferase family 4 protein [Acidipropionibacterium virtanenii]AXE39952.1 D-inositol-3-phosphate glycosyltransferase [Acidipropionibacterium virtanenii]
MPKRRVTVINHYAFPPGSGGITRNFDMFSRLKNWTPHFFAANINHTSGQKMTVDDPRYTLVPIPEYSGNGVKRMLGWVAFAAGAGARALVRPADVIFASSPQILAPAAAMVVAKLRRKPFVVEIRDLWPDSLVSGGAVKEGSLLHRVLVGLERTIYAHARQIVVVPTGWEDHFRELGINTDKITVVPNGADLAEYEVPETKEELRSRYGISGFTAVFSGTHANYVGLDLIVDAAEKLPDVNFLLVGSGARKQWAVDEAAARGLGNITFHDQVPKSELVRILRACDVGLHTVTPQEVFNKGMSPNKLYDYMAAGLAVVSNAKVPLRDVIVDDEVGAVVDPHDLVEGIARVRDADEATMDRWHARARELMADRFSLQASVDKLETVLEKSLYR